jgi:hypothetical protein
MYNATETTCMFPRLRQLGGSRHLRTLTSLELVTSVNVAKPQYRAIGS